MSSANPVFNTTNHAGWTNNVVGNFYVLSEDKSDKIIKWLDAPDSSGNFQAAREKHHEQTGTWFIEGEEYRTWKETPDSALWVYGTPGCGKTIICSTVIEKIRAECAADPGSSACAYFFFDSRNAQTDLSLHNKLIRSIIRQLSHQSSGFPASLVELYDGGHEQPSIASLEQTLQKILDGFERAYIIIDAVDECTDREKVLEWINKLTQRKTGNIQVLFSSRPEPDIKAKLQSILSLTRVTLNSRLAEKDIKTYVDAMLSMRIDRWGAETIARVRDALIIRSDGMFRWVALQISELFKCATRKAVDNQLRDLPQDLEGMYERSLLKSPRRQDLKRFLMWLAFSVRPLETQELVDVVTVDFSSDGHPSYDPDLQYFGPADMLMTCSSFVTEIEGEKGHEYVGSLMSIRIIKLAHMSVKDYLVSDRLQNGPASDFSINAMLAHSMITKTCLAYLFHLRNLCFIDDSVLESFPLGTYAARYWIKHMQLGGGEDEHLSQMMDCIFSLEESALANWVRLDDPDESEYSFKRQNLDRPSVEIAAPLYYACIHGLQRISRKLLIGGADANAQGGHRRYAPQAASLQGHDDIVRLPLEEGADVNALGGLYGTALQAASRHDHGAVVRLLLEQGADVNAQGGLCGNALQVASEAGHDAMIRLLLEQGADVNAQEEFCGTALQAASRHGRGAVVRLLLEQGADVNVQGGEYGQALQAASEGGHDVIVRMLLEQGADVNAQGGQYGNALQAASSGDHDLIVRLLLEQGADVNAPGGFYGNAVQAASSNGRDDTVRLLLEKGADINAQGGCYGNALQAASMGGHNVIVRLLLAQGADVKAQGGEYGQALQAASEGGHTVIVRMLLERGADVNARGGEHGNALQAASAGGHDVIVRLLLEQGADVNAHGGRYGNALQAASHNGYDTVVQLLLSQDVDVNAKGGHFGSALKAARDEARVYHWGYFSRPRHEGHERTETLLIKYGAIDEDSGVREKRHREDEQNQEQDDETRRRGNKSRRT